MSHLLHTHHLEIDSLTKEPADTLLMGDEVISTTPARENDKFIKSSVDDLVLIPRKSEVTSNSNSECDMPTPLPNTDVKKEDFDINSPLGEQVVDFLMENEDVAGLPRHLEFDDISSLDPPKSAPLNYEPLDNPNSVSRSLETSDLNLEDLTAEIALDDSIPTKIDYGYQVYQGRLLASFQDDAKYEHVGQDTRSQGGKDDQDKQGKDLKISDIKTKSKDNDKGSRSKITKHEGTSLQRRQRQRSQELNDKSNLIDLTKECHNELTSGEIVSLKILSRTMEVRS
ncbi:hypothetical protein Tco_0384822 [Tanacetum coccineum]